MDWKDPISSEPNVLAGKPSIIGTRLSVELILDRYADGWTTADLLREYPTLSTDGLRAAFAYAAEVVREQRSLAIGATAFK